MSITCSDCPNPASVEIIPGCFLCEACEAVLKYEIEKSRAKATRGKAGMAGVLWDPVRRSTAGTGLRVGEASADLPTTSEIMGVTAGETAKNSVLASLSFRSDASPTQGGRTCQKWDRSETRHRAVRSPRARQLIENAAQSLSDRSPALASTAMPGSIKQAVGADFPDERGWHDGIMCAFINSSSHSSDVEQPHCRRTRADSSPAASTIPPLPASATAGEGAPARSSAPCFQGAAGASFSSASEGEAV